MREHGKPLACFRQLKEIFRCSASAGKGCIEAINAVLRAGLTTLRSATRVGVFSYLRDWVDKKIRSHLVRACQRRGFEWKRWIKEWLYGTSVWFTTGIPLLLLFERGFHRIGVSVR